MSEVERTVIEDGVVFPTLYTRDKKGKARQWVIHTEGNKMVTEYGQVGGKQTAQVRTATSKNEGKTNATTPFQQAISEAESKWLAQRDREDYNEDIDKSGLQIRPMLAEDYHKKGAKQVDWKDHSIQPKLDGLRLVYGPRWNEDGHPNELISRKGEVYTTVHIEEKATPFLAFLKEQYPDCWALDGEIYLHGLELETIISQARKDQPGETEKLEYHLFDLVMPDRPFEERNAILEDALTRYKEQFLFTGVDVVLKYVPTWQCSSEEEMLERQEEIVGQGFEGTMIRNNTALYEVGYRSSSLHKYKDHDEKEFKIIDVWEDQNGNAMFHCALDDISEVKNLEESATVVTEDGVVVFGCTPKRTHEQRKKMLAEPEKYIGKWLTVKHYGRTMEKVPKFPVGLNLRECDELGNPLV